MKANKILVARPGTSRANKTGSWRTFYPVLDNEKCKGCGLCAVYCPEGCLLEEGSLVEESKTPGKKKKFTPDLEFCKGCGLCAVICPAKAIEMKEEEK